MFFMCVSFFGWIISFWWANPVGHLLPVVLVHSHFVTARASYSQRLVDFSGFDDVGMLASNLDHTL